MNADRLLAEIAAALGFLTRLPLPARWFRPGLASASGASAFPVAGALLAIPGAAVLLLAVLLDLPPTVAALLAVATLIAITGALHEDGLSDCADGFFGAGEAPRRLEIMKDSRIGNFGAIALVLSLLLRILLMAALIERTGAGLAALALLGIEAASRAAMVCVWQALPSARPGGVADRVGAPDTHERNAALIIGILIALCTFLPVAGLPGFLLAGTLAGIATSSLAALARSRIGGQTGDVLGAAQQVAAMSLLVGLVAVV